jgi:hypothetical protein
MELSIFPELPMAGMLDGGNSRDFRSQIQFSKRVASVLSAYARRLGRARQKRTIALNLVGRRRE